MSQESSKEELWEARVDASSGTHFFVHRLTKAVRFNPPTLSVSDVSKSQRVGIIGSIDVFRKQLVVIMSSASLDHDAKVKQCRYVLADTWNLLCADANADIGADPIFYVGTFLEVYESACISASVMLGADNFLTPCLSFLVKAKNGARPFFESTVISFVPRKLFFFISPSFLLQKLSLRMQWFKVSALPRFSTHHRRNFPYLPQCAGLLHCFSALVQKRLKSFAIG
jgi:hypothetical protein